MGDVPIFIPINNLSRRITWPRYQHSLLNYLSSLMNYQ